MRKLSYVLLVVGLLISINALAGERIDPTTATIEKNSDVLVVAWGHASYPRNGWIHRYSHTWGFRSADAPEEFADEILAKGLWKPHSRNRPASRQSP